MKLRANGQELKGPAAESRLLRRGEARSSKFVKCPEGKNFAK